MKIQIFNKLGTLASKAIIFTRKNSPQILLIGGSIGVVASGIMACVATAKLANVTEEHKEEIKKIHDDSPIADEKEIEKEIVKTYAKTGLKIVSLYAPSVILGSLSLGSMISSNIILRKRNVALAAAYTSVDSMFKRYRKNVIDRFGKDVDTEMRLGLKNKTADKEVANQKEQLICNKDNVDCISDYARWFDESNPNYKADADYDILFLNSRQSYANNMLKANGILFLNDVYKGLGYPPTKAGQVVGWVYDEKNPVGDNYVDFGFSNDETYLNEDGRRIYFLDFNVDGNVWKLMK